MAAQGSFLRDFENTCDTYLVDKAPGIPDNIKELLVKFGPYLVLLGVVQIVLQFLHIDLFYPAPLWYYGGIAGTISSVLTVVSAVLMGLAVPGLLQRSKKGWNLMYYSTFVSAINTFNVLEFVVVLLISLYVLFQLKSYYK